MRISRFDLLLDARLTQAHPGHMFFHMRTTLVIDDGLMRRVKAIAARKGKTLSSIVEAFLRQGVEREGVAPSLKLPALPSFRVGRVKANVADRDALYRAMDRE
jgi:hypothetical protein